MGFTSIEVASNFNPPPSDFSLSTSNFHPSTNHTSPNYFNQSLPVGFIPSNTRYPITDLTWTHIQNLFCDEDSQKDLSPEVVTKSRSLFNEIGTAITKTRDLVSGFFSSFLKTTVSRNNLNILVAPKLPTIVKLLCSKNTINCMHIKEECKSHDKTCLLSSAVTAPPQLLNQQVSLISSESSFDPQFIHSLPFSNIRIITAHGTGSQKLTHSITFLSGYDHQTKVALSLFKDKQDVLFLASCHGSAAHNGIEEELGMSTLVTFASPDSTISSNILREMEIFIIRRLKEGRSPLDIILRLVNTFPIYIGVKMPNKKSIFLNTHPFESMKNKTEIDSTVMNLAKYLEIENTVSFHETKQLQTYRKALNLFDLAYNYAVLDDLIKGELVEKIESMDAKSLNQLRLNNDLTLLATILHFALEINFYSHKEAIYLTRIVNHWIKVGADLGFMDGPNISALHFAIQMRDQQFLNKLVEATANTLSIRFKNSLLNFALEHNKPLVVKKFLGLGFEVNFFNNKGYSPLMASLIACKESFEDLIAAGANINAQFEGGLTAVHLAASNGRQINHIKRLIELGADVNILAYYKIPKTPLDYARDPVMVNILKGAGPLMAVK